MNAIATTPPFPQVGARALVHLDKSTFAAFIKGQPDEGGYVDVEFMGDDDDSRVHWSSLIDATLLTSAEVVELAELGRRNNRAEPEERDVHRYIQLSRRQLDSLTFDNIARSAAPSETRAA